MTFNVGMRPTSSKCLVFSSRFAKTWWYFSQTHDFWAFGEIILTPCYFFKHASALERLKNYLTEGNRALDIGSGSGYLTACMAQMVSF